MDSGYDITDIIIGAKMAKILNNMTMHSRMIFIYTFKVLYSCNWDYFLYDNIGLQRINITSPRPSYGRISKQLQVRCLN